MVLRHGSFRRIAGPIPLKTPESLKKTLKIRRRPAGLSAAAAAPFHPQPDFHKYVIKRPYP